MMNVSNKITNDLVHPWSKSLSAATSLVDDRFYVSVIVFENAGEENSLGNLTSLANSMDPTGRNSGSWLDTSAEWYGRCNVSLGSPFSITSVLPNQGSTGQIMVTSFDAYAPLNQSLVLSTWNISTEQMICSKYKCTLFWLAHSSIVSLEYSAFQSMRPAFLDTYDDDPSSMPANWMLLATDGTDIPQGYYVNGTDISRYFIPNNTDNPITALLPSTSAYYSRLAAAVWDTSNYTSGQSRPPYGSFCRQISPTEIAVYTLNNNYTTCFSSSSCDPSGRWNTFIFSTTNSNATSTRLA